MQVSDDGAGNITLASTATNGTTNASGIQTALSGQPGCATAGYVYSPQSGNCVPS
jgi:hypothetical protein